MIKTACKYSIYYIIFVLLLVINYRSASASALCTKNLHSDGRVVISEPTICIGVLAYRGKVQTLLRWSATARYLSQHTGLRFMIVPLNLDEMTTAIKTRQIHFTLTNPGNYVVLESQFGVSRIATMQTRDNAQTHIHFGAVIFARSDNPAIRSITDLHGKSFMAVSPTAFGGFQMAWRELKAQGINPFADISDLRFAGFPQDNIIYSVLDGTVDAATVRADTLIRMAEAGTIELSDFRILNPQYTGRQMFGKMHPLSTRLYPEWPFATLKSTPRELATHVARVLLSMSPEHYATRLSRTAGWTVPMDYTPVHRLMEELQIGPYAALRQTTFVALLQRYVYWFIALAILLLLLLVINGYISRTNRRLKHTQSVLQDEISAHNRSQLALVRYRENLEEQVTERTEDLKKTNAALEKSRIALRELVRITSAPDLSHRDKLSRLLDTGCRYFNLSVSILASIDTDKYYICQALEVPLDEADEISDCKRSTSGHFVSGLLEHNQRYPGEPLDIPDVEKNQVSKDAFTESEWKSYLGTTVIVNGKIYCSLEFFDKRARDNQFSQWDHELLKVMAQWIGDEVELKIAHDAQQRHELEFARVSRMNSIGEMAASLAHELNQPLTGAINYCNGCLRMLREGNADLMKLSEGMKNAVEGATMAANIIRRIRGFVQKGDAQYTALDLNTAVHNVLALVSHEAQRLDVKIELKLQDNLPQVMGDMIQLEQVVLNCIRNGLDAMNEVTSKNKVLRIVSRYNQEKNIALSIIDNGSGISENVMPRIFDAFYTTRSDGMGIGLSISRSIIEAHQGTIIARALMNGGTEFIFVLPTGNLYEQH